MRKIFHFCATIILSNISFGALAQTDSGTRSFNFSCVGLPDHAALTEKLKSVVKPTSNEENGGFELNMWATIVDRSGLICAVTKSGNQLNDQWLGSRIISAQKANTAAAFSLNSFNGANDGLALSTANLWAATQPGGSLFGLQFSNPVNADTAYQGNANRFGTTNDPLLRRRIGGVNVFGGGLALYNAMGEMIGGLGVSGDSSCADHNIAWKLRDALGLDHVPAGVSATGDDNIIYDTGNGFGHPECGNSEKPISENLPTSHPIGN
jgi:uncharacterized protein GlcG (DUF336 family)